MDKKSTGKRPLYTAQRLLLYSDRELEGPAPPHRKPYPGKKEALDTTSCIGRNGLYLPRALLYPKPKHPRN